MNKRALARELQKRKAKEIQQQYVHILYMEMFGSFFLFFFHSILAVFCIVEKLK